MVQNNKIGKNISFALLSQIVSLITSFVLGLIVPKFIDELQYAYWQTFVLYLGYASVLTFGILEGFILRYSNYDYDQLDKSKVASQFRLLLIINIIFCTSIIVIAAFCVEGVYKTVVFLVAIAYITRNIFSYNSYTFQMTNRINSYAISIVLQRIVYGLITIVLILVKVNDFRFFCLVEILGDIIAIIYGLTKNKGLYFNKKLPIKAVVLEAKENIFAGIFLLVANITSGLFINSAKMVTQWRWGELYFGKIAFGVSLYTTALGVIISIGIVVFPMLKRVKMEDLPNIYLKTRNGITPIIFVLIIAYFPLCSILTIWLPQYTTSLMFFGTMLPLVVFSSKVSLLTNNYLKVYRKEKLMLLINIVSVGVCFVACLISAYVFNSLDALLFSLVLSSMLRAVVSEIVVMKIIGKVNYKDFIIELVMTAVFVYSARYLSLGWGCLVYAVCLVFYLIIYRQSVMDTLRLVVNKFKRTNKNSDITTN